MVIFMTETPSKKSIDDYSHFSIFLITIAFIIALTYGFRLVFDVPPMGGLDEPFHWQRSVQIASGHFLADRQGPDDWGGAIDGNSYNYFIPIFYERDSRGGFSSGLGCA
jgi:hypothetical protein